MKRITSIAGVKVLPYWQAKYYTAGGMREVRAAAWHFAQGGGTDSWLLHPSNDNSSHLVVKYDGSLRQMVEFDDAAHSLHVSYDADDNDAPDYGIFSFRAAKNALGAGITDPNRYIIAIEIEGFYQKGPNAAQRDTIVELAAFLEFIFPKIVHLGHRDFQDYKPCPGPTLFAGSAPILPHGSQLDLTPVEEDMSLAFYTVGSYRGTATIALGRGLVNLRTAEAVIPPDDQRTFKATARISLREAFGGGDDVDRRLGYLVNYKSPNGQAEAHIMLDDTVESNALEPIPLPDCSAIQAELAAAQADLIEIARIASGE